MSNHQPLANEVRVASLIATQIFAAGITEDDEDFVDILSAETDILDRLRNIVRAARYVEAQSKALTEMQAEMRERKARLDRRADSLRSIVVHAMSELGLRKLEAPDLSIAVSAGPMSVVVTDESLLPDELFRITREPDRAQIKAAILRHGDVPGADLSNGKAVLTVRTG